MSYHRQNPSSLHYPQGFGGIFSRMFKKAGKQSIRTGEQVEEVESRFKAVGRALRGKTTHAPMPGPAPVVGPSPEQLEKEAALKTELEALRAEQQRIAAQQELSAAERAAEQEKNAAERAALEAQLQQQQMQQQQLQQQLVQERQKGIFTRMSEALFGKRQPVMEVEMEEETLEGLGHYRRPTRQLRNVYFQGWNYF